MQGILSSAARTAARATSSTESRSTPGIEATGCRAFSPSITNTGQIRSSVVSMCSRTMRRAQSARRLRRMRMVRSRWLCASPSVWVTGTKPMDRSSGRPNLIAMA